MFELKEFTGKSRRKGLLVFSAHITAVNATKSFSTISTDRYLVEQRQMTARRARMSFAIVTKQTNSSCLRHDRLHGKLNREHVTRSRTNPPVSLALSRRRIARGICMYQKTPRSRFRRLQQKDDRISTELLYHRTAQSFWQNYSSLLDGRDNCMAGGGQLSCTALFRITIPVMGNSSSHE